MQKWAVIENCATMAATAAIVLGLWTMGAGGWSLFGFALLGNMNSFEAHK